MQRRGVIDMLRRSAFDRRAQHRGVDHVRHLHVDGVKRGAVDLPRNIQARRVFAEDAVVRHLLQRRLVDRRHGRRDLSETRDLAVAHGAIARRVHHHARLGVQFAERHLPAIGGRLHQHLAHRGGLQPDLVPIAADRAAAIGHHLAAEDRIAENLRLHGWIRDRHPRPVGVHLFGKDHGQPGRAALPHFGDRDGEHDGAVRTDGDPGADRTRRCAFRQRRGRPREQRSWKGQGKGQAGGALQEAAPRQCAVRIAFDLAQDLIGHGVTLPAWRRARRRGGCADRCRSGRCCRPCGERCRRGSDSCWPQAAPRPA